MKWGAKESFLEEILNKTGKSPPALTGKVELYPANYFYWEVYTLLSASRNQNGFIPLSEVKTLCDLFKITSINEVQFIIKMAAILDGVSIKHQQERSSTT